MHNISACYFLIFPYEVFIYVLSLDKYRKSKQDRGLSRSKRSGKGKLKLAVVFSRKTFIVRNRTSAKSVFL